MEIAPLPTTLPTKIGVKTYHTAGSDTIFVQIYMDLPPGVPGVSKDVSGPTKHVIWGLLH